MTISQPVHPGLGPLRQPPRGLPMDQPSPPQVAESGDPFGDIRIVRLAACLERGAPQRLADVTERLNATHLDWHFAPRVVADAFIALAAAWMADYRNVDGFRLDDGPYGPTVLIEDTPRVDPWFVLQADALERRCRAALDEFARRDRITGDG